MHRGEAEGDVAGQQDRGDQEQAEQRSAPGELAALGLRDKQGDDRQREKRR